MKKYKIGYTQGVFDMFHVGHLNLLNKAKQMCEHLVVGVNSDNLTFSYKKKKPIICENDRLKIIQNIKCVDEALIVDTLDKLEIRNSIKFDVIFIGSDWRGTDRWIQTEINLKKYNAEVIYIGYTDGISSTMLRKRIKN